MLMAVAGIVNVQNGHCNPDRLVQHTVNHDGRTDDDLPSILSDIRPLMAVHNGTLRGILALHSCKHCHSDTNMEWHWACFGVVWPVDLFAIDPIHCYRSVHYHTVNNIDCAFDGDCMSWYSHRH